MTSKFFAGRPSGRPTASVRLGRAADAALDQLVLDELGAEPSLSPLPLAPARASRFGRSARTAVIERLEDRRLMAGDASVIQSLPYTLEFDSQRAGVTDRDGESTGFTWVQPNKLGTEYQSSLIDLNTAAGLLKLTTTGTSTAGGPWEGDNTQVNALQTQFNASTGAFTLTTRLVGPLGFLKDASEQGGLIFGPDQDNYVKLVAVAQPNGQFLQFVDEQKTAGGTTYVHQISTANSLTSIGNFAGINTLDLMIAGDPATGAITAYYRVNGGATQQLTQSLTLSGAQKSAFFSAAARAGIMAMAKNNLPPVTVTFDRFDISSGTPQVVRPSVNGGATTPLNGATDVWRDAFVSASVNLPNVGKGVDPGSLNTNSVLLYRTSDHALVPGHVSTSGAGDTITYQPSGPLDANTSYTFEVTSGVRDSGGTAFLPYKETFTTGTKITQTDPNIAFEQVSLPTATGQIYTVVTVGPDHKLYAGTFDGLIQRFTINADGSLSAPQNITTVTAANGVNRTITGLTFDPASTATNLVVWISHGQFAETNASDWTGKISRLSGPDLGTYQDYITNLPRSVRDHLTNQIAFGPDGALYFSQASNSSMGAADPIWGNRPEHLLNAAILRLDTGAVAQRIAAGQGALNVQTENNPTGTNYNPFAPGAPLTLYATGVRNAYDLVWTRGGFLYAPTNGSAAGGNMPSYAGGTFSGQRIDGRTWNTPVQGATNVSQVEDDFLFNIAQGGYYGHPNPTRGEFVLDGGNPTSGVDFEEFTQYPVGTQPDPNYRGAAYVFGRNHSPDGIIEYKGGAFNGALDGKLMVVRYSGGADVMVLTPDAQGNITQAEAGIAGLSGFVNPVDLAEDPTTGFLYIADYGAQKLILARTVAPGAHISPAKQTYYFNDDYQNTNTTPSPTQTIRISNTGTAPLSIPASGLVLSDTNLWTITNRPTLPATIPAGGYVDIGVAFKATSASGAGVKTATLSITSNDQGTPVLSINLRGLAAAGKGGQLEPSLQRVFQLYNLPISTGDTNAANTNLFSNTEPLNPVNDELYIQRLVKAGTGPVTIEPLATFAGGSPSVRFGYYDAGTAGAKTELFSIGSADAQTVNPTLIGTTSFDPGTKDFGLYATYPIFANTAYSEDGLNTKENTAANRRKVRFYALKNPDGSIVPNAYVFTTEDYVNDPNGAYDTQDFVGIIRNVRAAPSNVGEVGLDNQDGVTFPDRMIFNRIEIQPPDKRMDFNPATGLYDIEVQPPNNVVHDTAVMRVTNTGDGPLTLNTLSVTNGWQLVNPPAAGTVIPPGSFLDVTVQFVAHGRFPGQSGNQTIDTSGRNAFGGSAWSGTLSIGTDDLDEPVTTVQLAGWWQYKSEALMEPSLSTMVNNLFGYKTTIFNPGQQQATGTARGQVATIGEEVLSRYWVRADANTPVTVRQLAAYHTQGNTATVRWYTKNSNIAGALFTHANVDAQSLLPHSDTGGVAQASFNPGTSTSNPTAAFQFWIDGEWSDDTKNKPVATNPDDQGHHVRFFPARDRNGNLITNTWLMVMDYQGINYDYQDNAYLITNMRPESPDAPTGLAAAAQGPGIGLTWTAPATPTVSGYNVYRSTSATSGFTKVTTAPLTAASYLDVATAAGTTYYYKVTAVDNWGGESAASAVASGQRSPDTVPPAAPTGLTAASAGSGIQLTWSANTDPDLLGYRIYKSDSATGTFLAINSGQTVTGTTYVDTLAQSGQHWYYAISAVDLSGNESSLSAPADATVLDTTPPAVPTNLKATGVGSGIQLGWTASGDADLAGYRIFRSDAPGGTFAALNGGQLVTATTFTDTSVNPGETWYYYVAAVDTTGNQSAASNTSGASRPSASTTVVRINAGGGSYTDNGGVVWSADTGFTGGTVSTGAYDVLGTTDDPLFYNRRWGAMTYKLAAPDGAYTLRLYFADPVFTTAGKRVFSVTANGATILSNFDIAAQGGGKTALVKSFTVNLTGGKGLSLAFIKGALDNPIISAIELVGSTPADTAPPAVPSGLTASGTSGGINLMWAANVESDLAGYNLLRSTDPNGTFTKVNAALLTGTSYADTSAPPGVTSYYQLIAVDKSGNASAASNMVSATRPAVDTTPPAAPTGVTATGSSTGISLAWNANTETDLAGYTVYRSSSATGTFVKLNGNPLTSPKFFDTTVPAGATVYYRIVAVDKAGNASAATLVSAVRP